MISREILEMKNHYQTMVAPIISKINARLNFPHVDILATWVTEFGDVNGDEYKDLEVFVRMVTEEHTRSVSEAHIYVYLDISFGEYDNANTHDEIVKIMGDDFYDGALGSTDAYYRLESNDVGEYYQKIMLVENYLTFNPIANGLGKVDDKYIWLCESNDGYTENSLENGKTFNTQEEAYNDMRNAVLEKMKWNTNYEDFGDGIEFGSEEDTISYNVVFKPTAIVHTSYSGTYTYKVVKRLPMPKTNDIVGEIKINYNSFKQCREFYHEVNGTKFYVAYLYDNGYLEIIDKSPFNDPNFIRMIHAYIK